MKCHLCHNDLDLVCVEPSDGLNYVCRQPDHCSVWIDERTRQIDQYVLYLQINDKTYRFLGVRPAWNSQNHPYTQVMWFHTNYGGVHELLNIQRYQELYTKNDVIDIKSLFDKLQVLITFS